MIPQRQTRLRKAARLGWAWERSVGTCSSAKPGTQRATAHLGRLEALGAHVGVLVAALSADGLCVGRLVGAVQVGPALREQRLVVQVVRVVRGQAAGDAALLRAGAAERLSGTRMWYFLTRPARARRSAAATRAWEPTCTWVAAMEDA